MLLFSIFGSKIVILFGGFAALGFYIYSFQNEKNWFLLLPIIIGMYSGGVANFSDNTSIPITLFQLALITGILVFVLSRLNTKDFTFNSSGYTKVFFLFLSFISFSLIYSVDKSNALLNFFRIIVLFGFVFFINNVVNSKEQITRILITVSAMAVIISIFSIVEYIKNPDLAIQNYLSAGTKLSRTNALGAFSDPNRFAAALILPSAFLFSVFSTAKNSKEIGLAFVGFLILLGGVATTFSRSGFVSIALVIGVIIFKTNKLKPFLSLAIVGTLIVMVVPNLRLIAFSYLGRILDLIQGNIDTSGSIRIMLALAAIGMFVDTYMLGVGFDSFDVKFREFFTTFETLGVEESHNMFLTILSELGLIGMILLLFIIFNIFQDASGLVRNSKSITDKRISITIYSSLIGFLLFYQFYDGALIDNILMLVIGLLFCSVRFNADVQSLNKKSILAE